MAEMSKIPTEVPENRFDLAALVSERVKIDHVLLSDSRVKRSSDLGANRDNFKLKFDIVSIGFGDDVQSGKLYIAPSFVLKSMVGDEEDPNHNILIEASFIIVYSLSSFEGLEAKHFEAFGATNGIFNVWPYWREFVQSMSSRMGIESITVPVFRFN